MLGPARRALGLSYAAMAANAAANRRSDMASGRVEPEPTETPDEARKRKERERKRAYRERKRKEALDRERG